MQRLRLQMCLAVVTLHAVLATSAADPQQDVGIYASTENFERNLKYLTENMLPVDWKLNVVLKVRSTQRSLLKAPSPAQVHPCT